MPSLVSQVASTGSTTPLYAFCLCTAAAVSGMGGIFALLPAYEADLFGTKYVGAIHGRMLLFTSCASVFGPFMLMNLRLRSERNAIDGLLTQVILTY